MKRIMMALVVVALGLGSAVPAASATSMRPPPPVPAKLLVQHYTSPTLEGLIERILYVECSLLPYLCQHVPLAPPVGTTVPPMEVTTPSTTPTAVTVPPIAVSVSVNVSVSVSVPTVTVPETVPATPAASSGCTVSALGSGQEVVCQQQSVAEATG